MKRIEIESIVCRVARELGLPLPEGYRIEKNGSVTRAGDFDETDPYLHVLMLIVYQRVMIGEITKVRKWVTYFGVLTVISVIISIISLLF